MKRARKKLLICILAALVIIGITMPAFAESEQSVYKFYCVSQGENLDGKSFIILSTYKGGPPLKLFGTPTNVGFPKGGNTLKFENGEPNTKGLLDNDSRYSPLLGTYSYENDDYEVVGGVNTLKLQDNMCLASSFNEWTFEKNDDGTYSLYRWEEPKGGPVKHYLYSNGTSNSASVVSGGKGKYEVEVKDGGRIALKLVGSEMDRSMPAIDESYQYIVFSQNGYNFQSGSANDNNVLELYQVYQEGLVSYDYYGNMGDCTNPAAIGNIPEMEEYLQVVGTSEESLYTVGNTSKNGTFYSYSTEGPEYLSGMFSKRQEDAESFTDPSSKSSKIWGEEFQLVAWEAYTIYDDMVIIPLNATLKYETSTKTIKTTDIDGNEVALYPQTTLYAYYATKSRNVFFNIKYTTDIELNDGSLITEKVDTEALAVGHIYYPISSSNVVLKSKKQAGNISDYTDNLSYLSRLLVTSYNPSKNEVQVVIEGFMEINPETNEMVSYVPSSGKSISDIVEHTMKYIMKYDEELNVEDVDNINDYDVVWYGTEYENIGIMVRGIMRDMKNFLVIDATFEDIPAEEIPVDDFKIEILNDEDEVLKTLRLDDPGVEVSADKKTYTWKLNDMTENTYTLKQYNRKTGSYTSSTSASTDVNTNMGSIDEDNELDVVTLKVSTVNNKKDQVKLINRYATESSNNDDNSSGNNAGTQPSGGESAPAPAGGPVQQVIQSVYNGLLPKTGSASAFVITLVGIVMVVVAIRLRNKGTKKSKKKDNNKK